MDYACGSGADCDSVQPSGPCYTGRTAWEAHAYYALTATGNATGVDDQI
jgi:hypothetical protein